MRLIYFLLGSVTVFADYASITEILNICMFCCIPYTDFETSSDGVRLKFRMSAYKRLEKEIKKRGVSLTVERVVGIPSILSRYRRRYGIFVGIALAVSLIALSRLFIWDIDVVGNERLTTSEIKEILDGYGFSIGTYIPSLNTDRIENKLLIETDKISWISINVIGNVAQVQVREHEDKMEEQITERPANLIASKPGLVREVRIRRGNVVVGAGKYVEKGELLVSGLFDSNIFGFRYTRAEGEVYAETVSEYYVEIPYEYEGIVYTGEEYFDKYLNFFDFSINIFQNSRKIGAFYDKIDIVKNCTLPDGTRTPIEIRTVKYSEYELRTMRRTAEEAEELAYFTLGQRLACAAEDSVIIKKTIIPRVGERSFSIYCSVVALENIAAVSEFDVDDAVID